MAEPTDKDRLAGLTAQIELAEKRANPEHKIDDNAHARVQALAKVMRIGADFVTTVLAGLGLGWFVDTQMGSAPWCLISFLVVGSVIAFWNLIRATEATRASSSTEEQERHG